MKFFYLILGGLAAYRIALLISKEDGPADVLRHIREGWPLRPTVKKGLSCEWCVSIWAGAIVALYLWLIRTIPGREWPLYWLALSAIAVICNQQWNREE